MYEVALFFSIVSSVLFCIYLIMCILGAAPASRQQEPVIEIRGRIVTRTVTFTTMNENSVDNEIPVYTMPPAIKHR